MGITRLVVSSLLSLSLLWSLQGSAAQANNTAPQRPVFLHFFDWFHLPEWQEQKFVDPPEWKYLGIQGDDRASEDFYYRQFKYIKSLGVTALAWEYYIPGGTQLTYPSEVALRALRRSGLKIAPFYDWEICAKVRTEFNSKRLPTLSTPGSIKPDLDTVNQIAQDLQQFYDKVPADLRAVDTKGRAVNFVFGYGFDDNQPNPANWKQFGDGLVSQVKTFTGVEPAFYWTAKNSIFEEHLFLHHRDNFIPFHFVLDTPQSQFGHDSVTWNFGFDNLGVLRRDGLQRVVRQDKRYIEEMGWLSNAAAPSLLFIYSWNEPFEGSMLLPTQHWADTKARLAKALIQRMNTHDEAPLPKTLLIVDDLDQYWSSRKDDWHLSILRDMLLYSMRRFAPQADVRTVEEVSPKLLDAYPYIIDASSQKGSSLPGWLLERMANHHILAFAPLATSNGGAVASYFAQLSDAPTVNAEVAVPDLQTHIFVRDDVIHAIPCSECKALANITLPGDTQATPVVIQRGDDIWVNAYTPDNSLLAKAFSAWYQRPMNTSILYGEGLASQRLEVNGKTGAITKNTLARQSVNGHWAIPKGIDWFKPPLDIPARYYPFVFGQE